MVEAVLREAVQRLREVRQRQPDAGGLVIAADVEHARAIADQLVWRMHVTASVVTSDDPSASDRITSFPATRASGSSPSGWSRRGSISAPAGRRLCDANDHRSVFRQAVGRLVRWTRGERDQRAWMYIPDDPRLRTWAAQWPRSGAIHSNAAASSRAGRCDPNPMRRS